MPPSRPAPAPLREAVPPPPEGLRAIERVELRSAESAHEAVPPDVAREQRMHAIPVGTAMVFLTGRSRSVHLNRALGLGLDPPATLAQVDAVLAAFAAHKVRHFSVPVPPWAEPPGIADWLRSRGLDGRRSAGKLWRGAEDPGPPPRTTLRVQEVDPADARSWWDVQSTIWPKYRSRERRVIARIGHPGWRHYLAWDGPEPAACAALFVEGDAAHLVDGATLPDRRRRGAQSALIHRRIVDAIADGARWLTSETAAPLPRTDLISYRNLERRGFRLAYVRPTWRMEA